MTVKLCEVFKTRYFYLSFKQDLTYLFVTYLALRTDSSRSYNEKADYLVPIFEAAKSGKEVIFDLADARVTPDCIKTIYSYMSKGITFIDTTDQVRNEILAESVRRYKLAEEASGYPELPPFDVTDAIGDYIAALDKSVTYRMPVNNPDLYIHLAYLIQIVRPAVHIAFTYYGRKFFKFISDNLTYEDLAQYDEFYLTTDEGTRVVKLIDGKIATQQEGFVSLEHAMSIGSLVPTIVGSERLIKIEPWDSIARICIHRVEGYKATRKRTLEEIFS